MKSKMLYKILSINVIILFLGVNISSAIKTNTNSIIDITENVNDCNCLDIKNKDIIRIKNLLSKVIEKSYLFSNEIKYNQEISKEIWKNDLVEKDYPIICAIIGGIIYRYVSLDIIEYFLDLIAEYGNTIIVYIILIIEFIYLAPIVPMLFLFFLFECYET